MYRHGSQGWPQALCGPLSLMNRTMVESLEKVKRSTGAVLETACKKTKQTCTCSSLDTGQHCRVQECDLAAATECCMQ